MDIYGSYAEGITIDGDDVYVAGYTDWYEFTGEEETSGGYFPQYWKNSTIHDLEGGSMTDFGTGLANDIRVADGNIVVVGMATGGPTGESACYWLNGELNYLDVVEGGRSEATGTFIE